MECRECAAYDPDKRHCHRFPVVAEKGLSDWCMEFKAKEVIVCPVEEKVKVEEKARVEEKVVVSEPQIIIPEVKRGWPRGKPRK